MAKVYAGSIDLSKIDKTRIVVGKDGAKYYNLSIIINDEKDKYGNECAITEGQTKEQREAKEKKVYIGNAKEVWSSDGHSAKVQQPVEKSKVSSNDSDLPF